jgi:tetratricopeptide (TPR) repeat protein
VFRDLETKKYLLLLDNCEQLEGIETAVRGLTDACPKLHLLLTSRRPLENIAHFSVGHLSLDEADDLLLSLWNQEKSVGKRTCPTAPERASLFTLHTGNPLAITALVGALCEQTPEELLNAPMPPFTAEEVGLAENNFLWWNYCYLPEKEKQLFRRLGVPVGGFGSDLATQMLEGTVSPKGTQDLLKTLVRRGLVQENAGEFSLLPPIRDVALFLLGRGTDEETVTERIHAAYYRAWAESVAYPEEGQFFDREQQGKELEKLGHSWADIQIALHWWHKNVDAEYGGILFTLALTTFWEQQQYWKEGIDWLLHMLDAHPELPAFLRARVLNGLGNLFLRLGEKDTALEYKQRSLLLFREGGDTIRIGITLSDLGAITFERNDAAMTLQYLEEAIALLEPLELEGYKAKVSLSKALNNLALHWWGQNDLPQAHLLLEKSVAMKRDPRVSTVGGLAETVLNLGVMRRNMGDYEKANECWDEAESLFKVAGMDYYLGFSYCNQGDQACMQGQWDVAEEWFQKAFVALYAYPAMHGYIAACFEGICKIALAKDDMERIAWCLGVADKLRQEHGFPRQPAEVEELFPIIKQAQQFLGMGAYQAIYEQAHQFTISEQGLERLNKRSPPDFLTYIEK